jgi:hypothetical protein
MTSEWSRLRHDLRSAFNNVRLCLAALETETDPAERIQWLDYIEKAAEKCVQTLEQIERMPEPEWQDSSSGAVTGIRTRADDASPAPGASTGTRGNSPH